MSVMSDTEAGSRYCLYEDDRYPRHYYVAENSYMLLVLLLGAFLHAAIYGNITEVVRNMDSSGARLSKRLSQLNEFFVVHQVCPPAQHVARRRVLPSFEPQRRPTDRPQ
jgi:hypothetical protein